MCAAACLSGRLKSYRTPDWGVCIQDLGVMPQGSVNITEGQGVHREVKSEGLEEKYQVVTENCEPVSQR